MSESLSLVLAGRALTAKRPLVVIVCSLLVLVGLLACARGLPQLYGWTALQPDTDLWAEPESGPNGEPVFALLYTLFPGKEVAIERSMPIDGLEGPPSLRLTAKTTRVLYLVVVLLDRDGNPHECARVLQAGEWRTLEFDGFEPAIDDWSQITAVRLVDRTALLISQGPVSLKLVGLPR